jgi:dipeptidyl aminopeptidase/acylaminoacyl peptidase
MSVITRFFLLSLTQLILTFMSIISSTEASPLIERKILFGNPDKTMVKLSPNGKHISYIAPRKGVLNIWIAPSSDPLNATPITDDKDRGIRSYCWAYDNTHIIFSQDEKGDENFRLYTYNLDTQETKLLTNDKGVKALLYGISHRLPNEILVGVNERDQRYFDIYKFNILTGTKELLIENNKFTGFVADHDLNIRFAKFTNKEGDEEYFQFKDNDWQPFMTVSMEDSTNTGVIGFDKSGLVAYLLDSRDSNTSILKALNLENNKTTIIAKDDKADLDIFTVHPTEYIIQAVAVNYDKISYNILDGSIKEDIEFLQQLSNGDLIISSRTIDDKYWLVAFDSDISPVKYYKYDRSNKKASFLFSNRKDLEEYQLARMHPVIIKARDGLDLVSYITFPVDTELDDKLSPKKPLPLVLNVHGGPWARDSWGLDINHQWLANRGYVVLSINFRGSTGFGKNFVNAGNMQWGKKMHEDLVDSVNWAIENKIADPAKIAIMGGSYGGYAALAGVTFTPDLFACAIDVVGPSNLLTLINSVPPYWEPILNDFKKRIGPWDTEEEKEALLQISPLTFANRINKPLFIAQGANDPRVKQAESDQIVEEMQKNNIPVIYALYKDEGHGFAKPSNRLAHYALVEQFLAAILGGRSEPIGDDMQGANLLLNGKVVNNEDAEKIIKGVIESVEYQR